MSTVVALTNPLSKLRTKSSTKPRSLYSRQEEKAGLVVSVDTTSVYKGTCARQDTSHLIRMRIIDLTRLSTDCRNKAQDIRKEKADRTIRSIDQLHAGFHYGGTFCQLSLTK